MRVRDLFPVHAAAEAQPTRGKVIVGDAKFALISTPKDFDLIAAWERVYDVHGGSRVPADLHHVQTSADVSYWSFRSWGVDHMVNGFLDVTVGADVFDVRMVYRTGKGSTPYVDEDQHDGLIYTGGAGFVVKGKSAFLHLLHSHVSSYGSVLELAADVKNPELRRDEYIVNFRALSGGQVTPKKVESIQNTLPGLRAQAIQYRNEFKKAASQFSVSKAVQAFKILDEA